MTTKRLLGLAGILGALAMAPAQAQTEVVLYNFAHVKGAMPYGGVIRDAAGNLYGTAQKGGTAGKGVVYKLDRAGHYKVLYNFTASKGASPTADLIRDSAGNLYGTTPRGGGANQGAAYKLDTAGQETLLHGFTGGADGGNPVGGVILDSAGNLYGTTPSGGSAGAGTAYKVDTAGNETVLYSFTGGADGGVPFAGVISDSAGNLYGTAYSGGAGESGVVYKVDPAGNETVLYTFTGGADGGNPYAGVTLDPAGNLYGTTVNGGKKNRGVIFEIKP